MAVSSNLRGIGAMVLATGCFVANDSCMKLALEDAPPMQVLIMRGLAALTWCVPVVLVLGLGREIPKAFNPWVVLRALSEAFAVLGFVVALKTMPIADVTAIGQLSPFLVLVGASLIWEEKIGAVRLLLIAVGILGALLVAQPGGAAASPYAIFGFVCAVGAAGRDLVTRKVPAGTPALIVAFSTLLIVMLSAAVASFLFETQVTPTSCHLWLMAIAGLFLMGGQFFIYLAFRLAPPRVVAPFNYCFLLWAGLSGLLLFNDVPNALAIAGMALILLAGLAVIMLEGRTRQGDPKLSKA